MVATQFVEGLPESIKSFVRAQAKKTLDEAFTVALSVSVGQTPPTAPSLLVAQQQHPADSLCAPMQSLRMAQSDHRSPYRGARNRSTSRPRNTYDHNRYGQSPFRGRRPSRDRGRPRRFSRDSSWSQSRSSSRGRYRKSTPGRYTPDKKVEFKNVKDDPSDTCDFCKGNHDVTVCRRLRQLVNSKKFRAAQQQDFQ